MNRPYEHVRRVPAKDSTRWSEDGPGLPTASAALSLLPRHRRDSQPRSYVSLPFMTAPPSVARLPPRRRRRLGLVVLVVLFAVFLFLSNLVPLAAEWLWFQALGS